jgi:hypothetical protein
MSDDNGKDILITNPRTKEGGITVTKMLMRLFDYWELSPKDRYLDSALRIDGA